MLNATPPGYLIARPDPTSDCHRCPSCARCWTGGGLYVLGGAKICPQVTEPLSILTAAAAACWQAPCSPASLLPYAAPCVHPGPFGKSSSRTDGGSRASPGSGCRPGLPPGRVLAPGELVVAGLHPGPPRSRWRSAARRWSLSPLTGHRASDPTLGNIVSNANYRQGVRSPGGRRRSVRRRHVAGGASRRRRRRRGTGRRRATGR